MACCRALWQPCCMWGCSGGHAIGSLWMLHTGTTCPHWIVCELDRGWVYRHCWLDCSHIATGRGSRGRGCMVPPARLWLGLPVHAQLCAAACEASFLRAAWCCAAPRRQNSCSCVHIRVLWVCCLVGSSQTMRTLLGCSPLAGGVSYIMPGKESWMLSFPASCYTTVSCAALGCCPQVSPNQVTANPKTPVGCLDSGEIWHVCTHPVAVRCLCVCLMLHWYSRCFQDTGDCKHSSDNPTVGV
jgi:hypothetical protein